MAEPATAEAAAGTALAPAPAFAGETAISVEADGSERELPVIDSPSISAMPVNHDEIAPADAPASPVDAAAGRFNEPPSGMKSRPRRPRLLAVACVAMAALIAALIVWRAEVVRLLPQTAGFFKALGLDVNLRGLVFKDVKVSSEAADGKPVLVIEGAIHDVAKRPVELPRLRFIVRDARGAEIYAWNAALEQPLLKPGEKAWFKSRLAAPPSEARTIDVRFLNRRDLARGSA